RTALYTLSLHDALPISTRELVVDDLAAAAQELVRLREVLTVGALGLEQVRHRVQPEPVDAEVQPEPDDVEHLLLHRRVLVVEVRSEEHTSELQSRENLV